MGPKLQQGQSMLELGFEVIIFIFLIVPMLLKNE